MSKITQKTAPAGRWYVVSSPKTGADLWRGWAESAAKAYENAAPALEKLARTASKPLAIRVQRSQNRILTDEISAVLHPGETVQDLTDHQIDVPQTTRDASDRRRDAQIEAVVKIRLLDKDRYRVIQVEQMSDVSGRRTARVFATNKAGNTSTLFDASKIKTIPQVGDDYDNWLSEQFK